MISDNGVTPTTSTNAAVTNAQIVSTGAGSSNGFQLEGPDGNQGARRAFLSGLSTAWDARTAGKDIIELEFDINPGGVTTSTNTFGAYIYNSDHTKVLAGVVVRADTKELLFEYYGTPTDGGPPENKTVYFFGSPLPYDQFTRIGVSYHKTSGHKDKSFRWNSAV